jgi:ppGpp synthetase/RelA/SpoT-type nucleotidyltranferase
VATPWERLGLSRSAVDRAGRLLRDWAQTGVLMESREQDAMEVVSRYRAQFQAPLTSVVIGLRSAARTSGADVVVGQRLKRQPRIVAKLARYPRMELSRMQDIGGCRAILPDLATVSAVAQRVRRQKSDVVSVADYIASPKQSGYRAVHMVVVRDGTLVEIQLRTPWQQQWATLVEDLDGAYGLTLKDETGPEDVLRFLRLLGDAFHVRETSGHMSAVAARSLAEARDAAASYLQRVASGS